MGRVHGGMMLTVFDATDRTNPKALVSHAIEDENASSAKSESLWDYKAFRYLADYGKLIIPLKLRYWKSSKDESTEPLPENFSGFVVFDVSTTSITEQFRVSHTTLSNKDGATNCVYCGGMKSRSFVYNGDLMTVVSHSVISTNIDSAQEVWKLQLSVDGEK